jgi:hypothetical protein
VLSAGGHAVQPTAAPGAAAAEPAQAWPAPGPAELRTMLLQAVRPS